MRWGVGAAAVAGAMAVLTAAPAVGAGRLPGLSGEWQGTQLCDQLNDRAPGVFQETSPVFIAQGKGGRFRLLFRLDGGKASLVYEGILERVAVGDEVQGVAVACGGAFAGSEVIRLRPVGSSGGQMFFNGESQFFTNDFPGFAGSVNIGSCKDVYQRAARSQPAVPKCSVSPFGAE